MDVDAARKAAGLKPLPHHQPQQPATPEVEIDRSGFMDPQVARGIPCFNRHGLPGGATMKGTRPGDPVSGLGEAGTMILQGMLRRTRRKDHP